MKRIIYVLSLSLACLAMTQNVFSQENESLRDRLSKKKDRLEVAKQSGLQPLSVRAEKMNERQTKDLSGAKWIREIYRQLDVSKGTNAALNNPTTPVNSRMSLITLIFKMIAQGQLVAYDFPLDGFEIFNEKNKVDFKDVLERLEIPYERMGDSFHFDEMDIPYNEVYGYYIKEVWYFDQHNSVLSADVTAICPVLDRMELGDMGDISFDVVPTTRVPLFWIPYENLRPYAARVPVMTSDNNNAITKTIDDYFTLRLYEGEIYKTTNMENKILKQQYETEDEIKAAQKRIERELETFGDSLWVTNDSVYSNSKDVKKRKLERDKKVKAKNAKKNKAVDKRNNKAAKSSASGVKYSARDRRK